MFCARCGADAANAFFCPNCGSRIAQQQPPAAPRDDQAMVVVLGAAGVWLANRDDDGASATLADHPASTPTATQTTPDAPDPVKKKPKRKTAGPGDVRGLSAGLFCRDLYARGVSYPDAVAYWWQEGAPDRMDVELNGIPCETVYSSYDINTYW